MSMDALEFLKERKRMCASYPGCKGCPFDDSKCVIDSTLSDDEDCERIVATVKKWSAEHPRKTRQSVFLEQYPEAQIDNNGVLGVCPAPMFHSHRTAGGGCIEINRNCPDCRREFWSQVVE